jgi:tetratricopeptide (TPR) repeat protein
MFTIHRLVQAVIRDDMQEDDRKRWSLMSIGMVYETMVASDQETMYLYDRYLSHAQVCTKWIKRWNFQVKEAAYLLIDLSRYSRRLAFYNQAEKYSKQALDILHHCQPVGHSDLAIAYANLALAYKAQGQYQQAKSYFHQSLDILTAKNPVEDEGRFALSLSNLASCEMELGELVEAERHILQAKSILERIQLQDGYVAYCLNILATIYREQERLEDARQLYEKVLAIREQLQKPGDVEVAASLNNLATVYIAQGKPVEAESLNQRALNLYREVYGPEHPELARCLIGLGDSAALQNDWRLNEQYNQEALKMLSETVGADSYRLIEPLGNIAACAAMQKEYKRAQQFFKRALDLAENYPDVDIKTIVDGYAALLTLAGQHDSAAELKMHFGERLLRRESIRKLVKE